jgi:hypothetical protein
MAFSTNGGSTYGALQPYSNTASVVLPSADGSYSIAVKVFDAAGNSVVVTKSARLDRTGPTITSSITAPTNAGSYDAGQLVTLTYGASDVDNVASVGAKLDGVAITSGAAFNTETLTAGPHSIVITATDVLGNTSMTTITIQVHATVAGLTTAVTDGVTRAQITSAAATQLNSYLSSAQAALTANNHTSAKTYLASFVTYAQAQSGTTINAAYAALLVAWANDLIARL